MPGREASADNEEYDFILVGAGSASCLIASRLSQQLPDHRILVLEAGNHVRNDLKVQTPGLSHTLQSNAGYDWQYASAPEAGLNNRKIKQPRGKLVGGTSAINSHSVVFPSTTWHDRIANELLPEQGREEWTSQSMRDCYKRFQHVQSAATTADSNYDERVQVSRPLNLDFLQSHWLKAFEELGYTPGTSGFSEDRIEALASTRYKYSTIDNAIDAYKGERSHAATAFLEHALKRGNVTLKTGVKVDKIAFHDESATGGTLNAEGIYYTSQEEQHFIRGREIILCAGVFESPAVLERSGIGSKSVLEAADIPLLHELQGVGENLQDHLNCSLSIETQDSVPTRDDVLRSPELQQASLREYEQSRTGRLAEGPAHSFAFTPLQMLESASETQELLKQIQEHVEKESSPILQARYAFLQKTCQSPTEATATTFMLRSQRNRDLDSFPKGTPAHVNGNYVTLVAMLAHPFSRGSSHITSSDSSVYPDIRFNYLSHPLDSELLARHLLLIERLFQKPCYASIAKPNGRRLPRSFPHPVKTIEDAKTILPINSATNYHPCGTCAMMKEELGGVVDAKLRVYGTANVRVCDASVLPIIPRGNILSAIYAWAEKGVEIIVKETASKSA